MNTLLKHAYTAAEYLGVESYLRNALEVFGMGACGTSTSGCCASGTD